MTETYKFESPEAMYAELEHADLYSPSLGYYVFLYNEAGAVCHYELDAEEAKELAELTAVDGEYWAAFLGVGGHIWDSPDDEFNKPNEGCSSVDFCEAYYQDEWIDTQDFLKYYHEISDEDCSLEQEW